MNPTIDIDSRNWKAAANALFRTSSRSCVDFTNGQALKVAIESVRRTKKTQAAVIRKELNPVFVERILCKRFQKTRDWGVNGNTMAERVKNFIAARVRSAAFIASGWIPARKRLFSVVRQKPPGTSLSFAGSRQFGRDKGSAKPATNGGLKSLIFAEISNTALLPQGRYPAPGGDPMPEARQGLRAALREATRDMIETLARRLNKDFKPFQARR